MKRERYIDKEQFSGPEQIRNSASSQCHCISRMVPRWGM